MKVSERWYSDAELIAAGVFDGPAGDDALVVGGDDGDDSLIVIDNEAGDAWIANARAEFDVTEEVGA